MQNKKDLNRTFRRVVENRTSYCTKELFARWFVWLDVSDQKAVFNSQEEETEIATRMESDLLAYAQSAGKQRFLFPYRIAATVAGIMMLAAGVWVMTNFPETAPEPVVWAESVTLPGERKIILMPDGSHITLNNASKVRYSKNFLGQKREIFLQGEAFFEVASDKTRPFIVHAGQLHVTVLGTSFNIRHYQEDLVIDVVVATGTVGVSDHLQKSWTLTPGNKLSYDSVAGAVVDKQIDPQLYTGWQHGELIVQNEKLSDICTRLERWYGVTIYIETEPLRNKRISLRGENESLTTIVHMLELAGKFKAELNGRDIIIR